MTELPVCDRHSLPGFVPVSAQLLNRVCQLALF